MKNKLSFEPNALSLIIHSLHSRGFKIRLETKVTSQKFKSESKNSCCDLFKTLSHFEVAFLFYNNIYRKTNGGGDRERGMALINETKKYKIQYSGDSLGTLINFGL